MTEQPAPFTPVKAALSPRPIELISGQLQTERPPGPGAAEVTSGRRSVYLTCLMQPEGRAALFDGKRVGSDIGLICHWLLIAGVYCQFLEPDRKTSLPKKLTFRRSSQGSGSGSRQLRASRSN
jgi:hypothetical protein